MTETKRYNVRQVKVYGDDMEWQCEAGQLDLPIGCERHRDHHWCKTCKGYYGVPHEGIHEGPGAHPHQWSGDRNQCACRPCKVSSGREAGEPAPPPADSADAFDFGPDPITVPYPKGMSVTVEAPGFTITAGRDGLRITPSEDVHVTTVTSDSTGYGHDTWACSCGVKNESQFGGMFSIETHVPDGQLQIRVDTSNEEH